MIETRAPGYILRIAPEQLDLHRFERLAERAAEAGDKGGQAAELLREALGLWRGDALADLADEPFAHAAIERLEEIGGGSRAAHRRRARDRPARRARR